MTASEKVAYLKGLAEGLGISEETAEGKVMLAMIDVLDSLACDVEDLEANVADMAESIDNLSDDIAYVEDLAISGVDGDEECECDEDEEDGFTCGGDCAGCSGCDEEQEYEVTCPKCGEVITVYESDLDFGSIFCPSCGSDLEFDIDEEEEE